MASAHLKVADSTQNIRNFIYWISLMLFAAELAIYIFEINVRILMLQEGNFWYSIGHLAFRGERPGYRST
jgi:hypothetical protein